MSPLTITRDDQEIVVTDEELKDLLETASKQAAEAARKELLADPNSGFAAARREAEKGMKDAQKEIDRLKGELQKAGNTDADVQALKAQLSDAQTAREEAQAALDRVKAEHEGEIALIGNGVKANQLKRFRALLATDGVDLTDQEAVTQAIEGYRKDLPSFFTEAQAPPPAKQDDGAGTDDGTQTGDDGGDGAQQKTPPPPAYTPAGGAKKPPVHAGQLTTEEMAALSFSDYSRIRDAQEGKAKP